MSARALTIAVPKGRILEAIVPLFAKAGIDASALVEGTRKLVRTSADGALRFVLLKPDDVPTYVEYGAADLGIAGRDTLLERRHELFTPLDLRIGRCKLVVAGPRGAAPPDPPRVASKYPNVARAHFAKRGVQVEVISLGGSVEIAPLVGLADLIVDIVETGATLRDNDLEMLEVVAEVSTLVLANRAAYKLRSAEIRPLLDKLRAVL